MLPTPIGKKVEAESSVAGIFRQHQQFSIGQKVHRVSHWSVKSSFQTGSQQGEDRTTPFYYNKNPNIFKITEQSNSILSLSFKHDF